MLLFNFEQIKVISCCFIAYGRFDQSAECKNFVLMQMLEQMYWI